MRASWIGVASFTLLAFGAHPRAAIAGTLSRAWVSNSGLDSGACGPISTPCRTLNGALANVAVNGEIDVKDSGGFGPGPVNITQSVSIVNKSGATAAVQAPAGGGNAIEVNAPGGHILIDGLSISGAGAAANGVNVDAAANLTVTHCSFSAFANPNADFHGAGILVGPMAETVYVDISDTTSTSVFSGIWISPYSSAEVYGALNRVEAINGTYGVIIASAGSNVVISANQINTSENNTGIYDSNATLYLSGSVITANLNGIINNGTIYTYGNNMMNGNSVDANGSALSQANTLK